MLYLSGFVFALGLAFQIVRYVRAPAPLRIPVTPAPTTRAGVVVRLGREVILFESLFKASRWTWLFGWLFHFGFAWLALGHLSFFVPGGWLPLELAAGTMSVAGWMSAAALVGLAARRALVDRVRYVTVPSDYLMLVLLLAIVLTGLVMAASSEVNVIAVKAYVQGLYAGYVSGLPDVGLLMVHIALACCLAAVFPFSKLLHAPGVFFSPTRLQVDDGRIRRSRT